MPLSLTVWENWLFVLNSDNVVGFKIWANGTLAMIPNSMQSCPSDGNVEVKFSNNGRWLVVSQRGTTQMGLWTLPVDQWGVVWPGMWWPMTAHVPFGFDIDQWDRIFLAEVPMNSMSTWQLNMNGTLTFIDRNDTMQMATCWSVVHPTGMWAYAANAGSDTITGFMVDKWAHLWRATADGASATQAPNMHTQDMAISADGHYLYALGHGVVYVYWIGEHGELTQLAWWTNSTVLPNSVTGMLVPSMKMAPMPKMMAPAMPAAKKNGVIGGICGGVGGAAAIFLVRRRRRQHMLPEDPKPLDPTKVVQVHV